MLRNIYLTILVIILALSLSLPVVHALNTQSYHYKQLKEKLGDDAKLNSLVARVDKVVFNFKRALYNSFPKDRVLYNNAVDKVIYNIDIYLVKFNVNGVNYTLLRYLREEVENTKLRENEYPYYPYE